MEEALDLPIEISQGFTPVQLAQLLTILEEKDLSGKDVIFSQGQPADYIYILCQGKVDIIHKPYDGQPFCVAQIEPGGVFGWSAVLHREVYTSSAICEVDCELFRFSPLSLHQLCENHRETGIIFLSKIADILSKRMRCNRSYIFSMLLNYF